MGAGLSLTLYKINIHRLNLEFVHKNQHPTATSQMRGPLAMEDGDLMLLCRYDTAQHPICLPTQ